MNILSVSTGGPSPRTRSGASVATARTLKEVDAKLHAARPDLVLVDLQVPSLSGGELLAHLAARAPNVPILIVQDVRRVEPEALESLAGLSHAARSAGEEMPARELRHTLPPLYNPSSGRADARKAAEFLGLPLAALARVLGRSAQAVHKTPDAPAIQEKLSVVVRIATALSTIFGTAERSRIWLNAPHPDLDQTRPLELIKKCKAEIVADFLEDALLGHPD